MPGLTTGLLIAAIVLFIIAALPPVPYHGSLVAAGLACLAGAHLLGGA
jgi:hypothetical protein